MLKPLTARPDGPLSEVKRESPRFDKLTGDLGDLRIYTSPDGKTKYLRVWEGEGIHAGATTAPRWYEMVATPPQSPADTK